MVPVSQLPPTKTAFADEVLRGDLLPATRGRELEKTSLPAYLEGTQRVTLVALIYKHRIQQVLKSFPLDGAPPKRPTVLGANAKALDDGRRRAGLTVPRRQERPSASQPAAAQRPAAPKRGRPRKQPDLAAQPAG
jgi:hypothetical protein